MFFNGAFCFRSGRTMLKRRQPDHFAPEKQTNESFAQSLRKSSHPNQLVTHRFREFQIAISPTKGLRGISKESLSPNDVGLVSQDDASAAGSSSLPSEQVHCAVSGSHYHPRALGDNASRLGCWPPGFRAAAESMRDTRTR